MDPADAPWRLSVSDPKKSPKFRKLLERVKGKRAQVVIRHILKHGFVTTEDLKTKYGYDHPPRAARDVREAGIPLETFRVKSKEGRQIGAYRFADPSQMRHGRLGGRKALSKGLKDRLLEESGCKCSICLGTYEGRHLQVDHRVPYEVSGEPKGENAQDFMLLCGSCNRAKSWSCEHCRNWVSARLTSVCLSCYWASPAEYNHIAQREVRRIDVVWTESEVAEHDLLRQLAAHYGIPLPEYVKRALRRHGEQEPPLR